jgi:hypothetical protein
MGLAPGGVVITHVMGSPSLFYDDPAVHREDSAPADRPRSIDPDERIRMFRGVRQESGAGSIRSLPIPAAFADKIGRRGNEHRPYDEEQE